MKERTTFSLELDNVSCSRDGISGFMGVSLQVGSRDSVVICGRSGGGKSLLLEVCAGLVRPTGGRVLWNGIPLHTLARDSLFDARRAIGYLFQVHALISNLSLFENLALPLRYRGGMSQREIELQVCHSMETCGLFSVGKCFPEALSAAQLRCAALARALVTSPALLMLDEPTAGVDPLTRHGIISVLKEVWSHRGVAMIIVSNSSELVRELSCSVLVAESGRVSPLEEEIRRAGNDISPQLRTMKEAYEEGTIQRNCAG